MGEQQDLTCFLSIALSDVTISGNTANADAILTSIDGKRHRFSLKVKYENRVQKNHHPLLRMAFCMPLLNYGLFSKKIILKFPVSEADLKILDEMNMIFSRDIFVNKVLRRRADYILPEFIPDEKKILPEDGDAKATVKPIQITADTQLCRELDQNKCGVLSSGGKESLLTYGLLKEAGADVHPLYVNESGGHWRTALAAYRYHKETEPNTARVWTNVDRFYNFMLDHLKFIRPDHRNVRADTYPVRLCIFPFYVFASLPIFVERGVGNLLIGSEFDDMREKPIYCGIPHYYGIYDQHQDFDLMMNKWYERRIPGMKQWSALRNISGLIVERILTKRYPHLARFQRSCHSCHIEKGEILPCGKCSKCCGVLLFLLANRVDPKIMNYRKKDIELFKKNAAFSNLRLDPDEKSHSLYLLYGEKQNTGGYRKDHVEKIHINSATCDINVIPLQFRDGLMSIIEQYTRGYCKLDEGEWKPVEENKAFIEYRDI